jgi:hypothetical protein
MIMKTIPFLFLLAASMSCFAQNKEPKNELGMNLYGFEINVKPRIDNGYNPQSFYFSGAQYKRAMSEHYNLRVAGQYFTNSESDAGILLIQSNVATDGSYAYNIDEKGFETRAGVERTFLKKKIKPFVFADLAYRHINTLASFLSNGEWFKESSQRQYGGALCGIGVKYYPTSQLYFSLESSIGYYLNFGKEENKALVSPVKTFAFGVRF